MRKAFATYMTQSGQVKELFMPTNGRNIVENLSKGNKYTILYKLGNRTGKVKCLYEDHTEFYKSLLVRDLERKNRFNEYIQMAIPTENVLEIHAGIVDL